MKTKIKVLRQVLSIVLCLALVMAYVPLTVFADTVSSASFEKIVDVNTMNNWTKYFDVNNLDTTNAGGIWTDKSVFSNASVFDGKISMIDGDKNFLTALSALAANKEVVGYSTVPTDTVFILDLSNSMSSNSVTDLVDATNAAIANLQKTNKNNRVGVVLYSGSSSNRTYDDAVSRLLPIDRYTTTDANGRYVNYSGGVVSVNNRVSGTNPNAVFESKNHSGATYIQAGLWEAYKMFNEVPDSEIVISDNNWQSGEYRMPIVVLMSDGAPTLGASDFDDVENQTYGQYNTNKGANIGDGNDSGITVGQSFLVQLTASYIKNRIENKYKVHSESGAGRSLFYTLGFNISTSSNLNSATSGNIAYSVLNPNATTITDSFWTTYNNQNTKTMQVSVEGPRDDIDVTVNKNSYATSKSYVDKYFAASGNGLANAFNDIVQEIILQSRYYPTHLEGGSPDFSGYIEFVDQLGKYMEVKHINGILLGDKLFDGHMMASMLGNASDGLGTVENPTALGHEFINAVKTRLSIATTDEARLLVSKAFADGQLRYINENDWSNYIAWYSKADGTYVGFYDEDGTEPVPAGAVYLNRSYGFLGETTGSIKNSDMMYMSVQVRINLETGDQIVLWKIPAALVPMVTYLVTLEGTNVETATNVNISIENADAISPIRLVYETGLRSDLNEFNITRITDNGHVDSDGHTRLFWNNYFDISSASHDEHVTTTAEFTPNKENERFYYTFDSAVHKRVGDNFVLVGQNEVLDQNGEYYHRRYVFKEGESKPVFVYEKMSPLSILVAHNHGWDATFETKDGQVGAWVVPKGTPARELKMYDEKKSETDDIDTRSAKMVFHPYLIEHNNIFSVDMNLGNNGLLKVTPATGIKISKTVDVFEVGTSDTFKFRVSTSVAGQFNTWITALDKTPEGQPTVINFANGVYEVELKKDQTLWITGIPAGTTYTVEEISDNADYKIKSVHVNGISTGTYATGVVAQYLVDDVDFVNTAIGEGDLVITKQVVDSTGRVVDVNDNIEFTAEVTLIDARGAAVSGSFDSTKGTINVDASGRFTVKLTDKESIVIRGIPEETRYTVVETNIPTGFALDAQKSVLSGVIDTSANDQALIVNTYNPTAVGGQNINVEVVKQITGNRNTWLAGESYTFILENVNTSVEVGTKTISHSDAEKKVSFSLLGESYDVAGTYYYKLYEKQGAQGGITYDVAERVFSVVVADSDMDGDLEIVAVNNVMNTSVSGNWLVSASFNNVYAPTGSAMATINIEKQMNGNHALSGYQFVLYDADPSVNASANEITRSGLTNSAGKAVIVLNYSADAVGKVYTYYLAEVNRGEIINNIKYSNAVYKIEVEIKDNLDGTISAETTIHNLAAGLIVPTFINEYVPSDSDFVIISGNKEIVGDRVVNANEFEFEIVSLTTGAPMPTESVVKNHANGSFSFSAIEFGDAHKGNAYEYKIVERNTNIGGFEYDNTVYTVTVTVVDNGDQTITANAKISNGTSEVDNIVFKNIYDATDAEVVIGGTKLLTGKTMQDDEFEFEIVSLTAGAPMPTESVVKNKANGEFGFEKITFNKAGVYKYQIVEKNGGVSNYDYDQSVYLVTVTVSDNSQGMLSAKVDIAKNNIPSNEIVFRNSFIPTPINYDIYVDFGGSKTLNGRPIKDGEFEFQLINAQNGQQIGESVRNDVDGKFRFPEVVLHTDGIHHFKIVETVGDEKGITYDNSSFHIRLEVVQDDNGVLSVVDKQLHKGVVSKQEVQGVLTEVTTYENITDIGNIDFVNSYKADPVQIVLEATKTLTGRDLENEEFSFELYDKDENKLGTVKNDANGKIVFSAITVDKQGEYVYSIREVKEDAEGITYDETVYTVNVKVEDNLDGTFKVEYGYSKGAEAAQGVVFVNVYEKPTPPDDFVAPPTGETTNLFFWFMLILISGGGLIGTAIYSKFSKEEEN